MTIMPTTDAELRDYFAAHALIALLAGNATPSSSDLDVAARAAFAAADAMVRERDEPTASG